MDINEQQKLAQTISANDALEFVKKHTMSVIDNIKVIGTYGYKPKDKFIGFGLVIKHLNTIGPFKMSIFDFCYPNIKVWNNKWPMIAGTIRKENGEIWIQKFNDD